MSTKPAPRCPGCGKEMELMELERNTWRYSCEYCGWRSPAVHGPGKEGKDAAIIACGEMVAPAVKAAELLKEKGMERGLDIHVQRQDIFEAMHRI